VGLNPEPLFEVAGSQTWAISLSQMHPWLNFQDLRSLVYHKVNGGRPHFENLPGFVIPITRPLDQVEDFENLWRVWKIVPSYQ
jgi:hypothetical protein